MIKLTTLTNEEIDALCAEAQGWKKYELEELYMGHNQYESYYVSNNTYFDSDFTILYSKYHPTQDSESGRSQAFELMVKFKLSPVFYEDGAIDIRNTVKRVFYFDQISSIRLAICYATILSQLSGYEL